MNNSYRVSSLFSINAHFFYDCTLSIEWQPFSLYKSHNNEPVCRFHTLPVSFIPLSHCDMYNPTNGSTVKININNR